MSRADHLEWAKKRALQLIASGFLAEAFASMMSDLAKHDDLRLSAGNPILMRLGMLHVQNHNSQELRRWVEGFN